MFPPFPNNILEPLKLKTTDQPAHTMIESPKKTRTTRVLSPAFTQSGRIQTYTQKVAATMNWWRRSLLGLKNLLIHPSGFFITRAPEFSQMSKARKNLLSQLETQKSVAQYELDKLIKLIEEFQSLPITLEDEAKGKLPKKRVIKDIDTDMPF